MVSTLVLTVASLSTSCSLRLGDFIIKADKECEFVTVHMSSVQAMHSTGDIVFGDN